MYCFADGDGHQYIDHHWKLLLLLIFISYDPRQLETT